MILLKKIQLTHFLSHQDTAISFDNDEKVLIDGASGAGKSSLFDAIIFALYGVGRADGRSLVRKGAKKATVVLELQKDELESVIITRSITSSGKHSISISSKTPEGMIVPHLLSGVRETQEWIDKVLIGASYLLFINSVAYVQGNADSFVLQTAPKRKELLLEIVNAEDYTKYYENARQRLSELENDKQLVSYKISSLKTNLDNLKRDVSTRYDHVNAITQDSILLSELEPKIKELEDQKVKLLSVKETIKILETEMKRAVADMQKFESDLLSKSMSILTKKEKLSKLAIPVSEHKKIIEQKKLKIAELDSKLDSASLNEAKRNDLMRRKPVINHSNPQNIINIQNKIKRIESEPVCPSGEKCPYSGNHSQEILKLKEEIKSIEQEMKTEAVLMSEWEKELSELPISVDLHDIISEIKDINLDIEGLTTTVFNSERAQAELELVIDEEKKLLEAEEELKRKKVIAGDAQINLQAVVSLSNPEEINMTLKQLEVLIKNREELNNCISGHKFELKEIDKKDDQIKSSQMDLEINEELLNVINKNIAKVEMVKQAFGSKGIETMVIDFILPKLEDKINEVLGQLSDFRVRLDTQKKSADEEKVIEGLFITIINEINEEMPFESYSGGEKLKISVAISEALASLQRVGFRLFDETFIGLDENSTESFASVLQNLQKNFGQVLCISHLLQIKELFDKKINIIKNKNISYAIQ